MRFFSPTFDNLRDLYLNELRDLYSAETQIVKALPDMVKAATSPELKRAFESHLAETQQQVKRLEQIFGAMNEDPSGETCEATKGLIKEASEYVDAGGNADVRDAGLIGAAQRVEHYEMAGYGTARALAQKLGENDAVKLLQITLDEEGNANKKLTAIAEGSVNAAAASA